MDDKYKPFQERIISSESLVSSSEGTDSYWELRQYATRHDRLQAFEDAVYFHEAALQSDDKRLSVEPAQTEITGGEEVITKYGF